MPETIRDGVTDYIAFSVNRIGLYAAFVPKLMAAVSRSQASRVVDLCSGGGGPWASMLELTKKEGWQGQVLLTDYFPNTDAFRATQRLFPEQVAYTGSSVSALDVPEDLRGFRTLSASFHHFTPDQAKLILQDAVSKNQGIAVAEYTHRHPLMILTLLFVPIPVWLLTPFFRPFRWSRLFWTYLCPVIPLIVMFDGIVSCLRTYTPEELKEMVTDVPGSEKFDWDIGVVTGRGLPVGVGYLIGVPKRPVDSAAT